MDRLPLELGEFIFQYVAYKDQLHMVKGGIGGFISAIMALNLKYSVFINKPTETIPTEVDMELIVNTFPLIQDLDFCCAEAETFHFKAIGRMKNLRKLYIESDILSNENIGYICEGESRHLLEDLHIGYGSLAGKLDMELSNLQNLSNLKKFSVFNYYYEGSGYYEPGVLINTICTGRSFHTLEELSLSFDTYNYDIHSYYCKKIVELPALRKLELYGIHMRDNAFKIICDNTNLEYLSLMWFKISESTSNNGFKAISSLSQLKTLVCDKIDITNDCLSVIGQNCTALEELSISGTEILIGDALQYFLNLKRLYLNFSDSNIDDNGLYMICTKMSSLEELLLKKCDNITADAFSMIKNLQKLKKLSISKTVISDKSLSAILTIPTLRYVTLQYMNVPLCKSNKLFESHHFRCVNELWNSWVKIYKQKVIYFY